MDTVVVAISVQLVPLLEWYDRKVEPTRSSRSQVGMALVAALLAVVVLPLAALRTCCRYLLVVVGETTVATFLAPGGEVLADHHHRLGPAVLVLQRRTAARSR